MEPEASRPLVCRLPPEHRPPQPQEKRVRLSTLLRASPMPAGTTPKSQHLLPRTLSLPLWQGFPGQRTRRWVSGLEAEFGEHCYRQCPRKGGEEAEAGSHLGSGCGRSRPAVLPSLAVGVGVRPLARWAFQPELLSKA